VVYGGKTAGWVLRNGAHKFTAMYKGVRPTEGKMAEGHPLNVKKGKSVADKPTLKDWKATAMWVSAGLGIASFTIMCAAVTYSVLT